MKRFANFGILIAVLVLVFVGVAVSLPNQPVNHETLKAAREKLETERLEKAKKYFDDGMKYIENGQFAQAKDKFEELLRLTPDDDKVYFQLGIVYNNLKEYNKAKAMFQKVTEINSNNAEAYYEIALIHKNAEEYDKAKEILQKVAEIEPNGDKAYFELGKIYFDLDKDYISAMSMFKKATELNPQSYLAHYNLGSSYFNQKDYTNAIEEYEKVVTLKPDDDMAYVQLASAYSSIGNYNEGLKNINRALEMNPKNESAIKIKGIILTAVNKQVETQNQQSQNNQSQSKPSPKQKSGNNSPYFCNIEGVGKVKGTMQNGMGMVVYRVSERETVTGGIIGETLRSSGKYVVLDVVITSDLNETTAITSSRLFLVDENGRKYSVDSEVHKQINIYTMKDYFIEYKDLNPGLTKGIGVIFDVPRNLDINRAYLEYEFRVEGFLGLPGEKTVTTPVRVEIVQ